MTALQIAAATIATLLALWLLCLAARACGRPCPRCRSRRSVLIEVTGGEVERWACCVCPHKWLVFRFHR